MASRPARSRTTTSGVRLVPLGIVEGPHRPWCPPACAQAHGLLGENMPCSWCGSSLCGVHWPRPLASSVATAIGPPRGVRGGAQRRGIDFVVGLAGPAVLLRQAAPLRQAARGLSQPRTAHAQAHGARPPPSSRVSAACASAAASWAQPWRVMVNAAVLAAGAPPRFVVTALEAPTPQQVYAALSGARGHGANALKAVQPALHSDRTSAPTFLAHAMRSGWRAPPLSSTRPSAPTRAHTPLATAHPATLILTRCTGATQVKQYKERLLLPLPSSCPLKALLRCDCPGVGGPLPVRQTS